MIAIIDYGMGNIHSIRNAFEKAGVKVDVVGTVEALGDPEALVIPGVGSFSKTLINLQPFREKIIDLVEDGLPFLGICMGMQALFERSQEGGGTGFEIIKGDVVRLPDNVSVPHIGWNELKVEKDVRLLEGIQEGDFFYFAHSYHCIPADEKVVAATTSHGIDFVSLISKDNVSAVQFHPEKSGDKGLLILNNFVCDVKC